MTWAWIPASLTVYVILGSFPNLSEPSLLHLWNGDYNTFSRVMSILWYEEIWKCLSSSQYVGSWVLCFLLFSSACIHRLSSNPIVSRRKQTINTFPEFVGFLWNNLMDHERLFLGIQFNLLKQRRTCVGEPAGRLAGGKRPSFYPCLHQVIGYY